MNDETKSKEQNVIPFPGVGEKLVEKGMASLKEKRLQDALDDFQQALKYDQSHPQARYGVVLTYIELGQLDDAVAESKRMLQEGIGDYFDVLQVHVSLLVQLACYEEVVTMLEAVLVEGKVPSNQAETLYQLLHFSRQMSEDGPIIEDTVINLQEKEEEPPIEQLNLLEDPDVKKQWAAIQKLKKHNHPHVLEKYLEYLKDEEKDLVLKTFILQSLKDKNIEDQVEIRKLDQVKYINPQELNDLFENPFGQKVASIITYQLEQDNPSLKDMVLQLWWQYLFALVPFLPQPQDENIWAGAVHLVVIESLGGEFDENEISNLYNVNVQELVKAANELVEVEEQVFQGVEM
ncbi:tetratricopeptide repeat protein [Alkalihalobacterium chitinilyticum]|uniref:Tetratricopeptide repeat protein n=1 Tax=Alkalihalobacterium chitinilyticum TaxID=2980103 RepID=A0ABT5VDX3_9BACI|nr:tetratricopeptide repeat protein [Alkalihalobacterium chitinilyticum]MDE5412409.1 tetratricopeptide repeat protein [Alkalihalobacterium chitinilyticum]